MSKEKKTKKKEQRTYIGGQAVLEGVMMRGKTSYATAVRDPEGNIQVEKKRLSISKHMRRASKIPLVRGVVNFVSSLVTGSKILMRSAEVYGDTDEPSKFEIWCRDKLHINVMSAISVIATVLGVALAVGLFVALPMLLANLIFSENLRFGNVWYNLTQGGLRLVIFILYIVAISAMKDIRRVFMYHGAEHKTITCFEKGLDLTPENAKTCSRIHDRCGTTFMFLVMAISIVVFSIINWLCDEYLNIFVYNNVVNYLIQFAVKLLFIPLVAGLSYEVLKLLAKSQSKILLPVKAPGFLLQRLTTREPDDSMLEVAIAAFNSVYQMDADPSVPESEFTVSMTVRKYVETLKEKFKAASIDESDAEWLVACSSGIARSELYTSEKMFVPTEVSRMDKIARERLGGRPLWYILGDTEFYGYKIKVDERVLIPRPETELLAEIAVKTYEEGDKVLDLCTGSGDRQTEKYFRRGGGRQCGRARARGRKRARQRGGREIRRKRPLCQDQREVQYHHLQPSLRQERGHEDAAQRSGIRTRDGARRRRGRAGFLPQARQRIAQASRSRRRAHHGVRHRAGAGDRKTLFQIRLHHGHARSGRGRAHRARRLLRLL